MKIATETSIIRVIEKKLDRGQSDGFKFSVFNDDNSNWFDFKSAGHAGYYYMRLKHNQLICSLCLLKVKKIEHLDHHLSLKHMASTRVARIVMTKNEAIWGMTDKLEKDIELLKMELPKPLSDRVLSTIRRLWWVSNPHTWTADLNTAPHKPSDEQMYEAFQNIMRHSSPR